MSNSNINIFSGNLILIYIQLIDQRCYSYKTYLNILVGCFIYKQQSMEFKRKLKAMSGIRDFSVCEIERVFLAIIYDIIKIYDVDLGAVVHSIKLQSSPRLAKLAPNGRYFAVYQITNTISIFQTCSGILVQKIFDTPQSVKAVKFSKNSAKLIYGSSQMLCLWDIKKCQLELRTSHWKNINCFDINSDGSQFAVGNYNGSIFILNIVADGKCTQIQITRHTTCVIAMCFHNNKLISISYDGHLLISTLSISQNGERLVTYNQMRVTNVPRQIQSVGNNIYFLDHRGLTWFSQNFILVGFVDNKIYKALYNQDKELIFVKLIATEVEWWKANPSKSPFDKQNNLAS